MSKSFWAKTVNTAVFVLNRMDSNPENTISPFEIWRDKKKVDMSIFKIFGLKVAAHIPKQRRLKLDVKSKERIFIGYSEEVEGYRIYFHQSKKVEILKDVVFLQDENKTKKTDTVIYEDEEDEEGNSENDDNESRGGIEEDEDGSVLNDHEQTCESSLNDDYISCEKSEESLQGYRLRDRSTLRKPKAYENCEWNFMSLVEEDEPLTYEAVTSNESEMWKKAIKEKIEALKENNT